MNEHIPLFRTAAATAARALSRNLPQANREFGLGDFLANDVREGDDPLTIAVNAVVYFCDDAASTENVYRFGAIVSCLFLHLYCGHSATGYPQGAIVDLNSLLSKSGCADEQIRRFFESHFADA